MFSKEAYDAYADGIVDRIYTYTYDADGNLLTETQDYNADGIADSIYTYTWVEIKITI